jgi:hypothetical protein
MKYHELEVYSYPIFETPPSLHFVKTATQKQFGYHAITAAEFTITRPK